MDATAATATARYRTPIAPGYGIAGLMLGSGVGAAGPLVLAIMYSSRHGEGAVVFLLLVLGVAGAMVGIIGVTAGLMGSLSFTSDTVTYRSPVLLPERGWSCPVDALVSIHLDHRGMEEPGGGYQDTSVVLTLSNGDCRAVPRRHRAGRDDEVVAGSLIPRAELDALYGNVRDGHLTITEIWHPLATYSPSD